jgi:arylsulfatase A-like enzyme
VALFRARCYQDRMPAAIRCSRAPAAARARGRPGRLGCLLTGLLLLLASGCGRSDPGVPDVETVYDLRTFLPVSEHESLARRSPKPLGERGFRLWAGSSSTWSFVLPAGAVLRGRADGLGGPGAAKGAKARPVQLSIVLRPAQEAERLLLKRNLVTEGARFPIEVVLGTKPGQMASLRVALHASGNRRVGLDWQHLEVVAPRRPVAKVSQTPRAPGRNVLFVLFDTLRADRTEPYGSETVETPAMTRLAARGTTFLNAFSNASWTAPSVASLLTSTYPTLHGVRGTGAVRGLEEVAALAPGLPHLPLVVSDAGYATVAVLNNPAISPTFGFGRGFDETHEFWRERKATRLAVPTPEGQADLVWDRFLEPVLRARGERPFFAYVHEIDPHSPYDPPPPYDTRYGTLEGVDPQRLRSLSLAMLYKRDPGVLSQRDVAFLHAQYAGEITFMDAYLGRLIDRLEDAALRESTLVVFVSDHGESLTDHLRLGHGDTLYDEVLRVPLIFSLPGLLPEGQRVVAPVQLIDVAPTILDLLDLEIPPLMQGESLVPLLAGAGGSPLRPSFAEATFEGVFSLDAVRFGRFKLIRRFDKKGGGSQSQLFDLAADPQERENLVQRFPVVAATLRQMLDWRRYQDLRAQEEIESIDLQEVDEQLRSELRALGYVQ